MKYYLNIEGKPQIKTSKPKEKALETYLLPKEGRHIVLVSVNDMSMVCKCGSVEWLCRELNSAISDLKIKKYSKDLLYHKFAKYCLKMNPKKALVSPIYSSENGYDLLKMELELLIERFGQKDNLNSNNIPYIPKTIHANKGSNWLKQNEYLNFMKLLKNYEY